MIEEIWKDINGYEGQYQISNYGRVKSLSRFQDGRLRKTKEFFIKQFESTYGYYQISLFKNHKKKNYRVHRLVAENFIENPKNMKVVNHIDGNKKNNRADNLEWVTYRENTHHAWKLGLCSTDKNIYHTIPIIKLNKNNKVIKIYKSEKEASIDNNISIKAINNCLRGISKTSGGYIWKYLKKEGDGIGA